MRAVAELQLHPEGLAVEPDRFIEVVGRQDDHPYVVSLTGAPLRLGRYYESCASGSACPERISCSRPSSPSRRRRVAGSFVHPVGVMELKNSANSSGEALAPVSAI